MAPLFEFRIGSARRSHLLASHLLGSHLLVSHWLGSHLLSSFISFIRFLTMENDPTVINNLQLLSIAAGKFADETGCNMNQKKDGHIAGMKDLVKRGTVPKIQCATSDRHFTLLGLTAATSEPLLCVIIFAGEGDSVPALWTSGIDITVKRKRIENN
jgi:hypothetical protein